MPPARDDLERIAGIDAAMHARLNQLGVHRYWQIAGWRNDDVNLISHMLGANGRIAREGWIEQARILGMGCDTQYSFARASSRAASSSVPTPPASIPPATAASVPPAPVAASPSAAERATANEGSAINMAAASAAAALMASRAAGPDKLQRIIGIDAQTEKLLVDGGVARFLQIAAWTGTDVEQVEKALGKPGRVGLENWIEQARVLSRGLAPEAPRPARLADAIRDNKSPAADGPGSSPRRADLAGLRSVRSEALRGDAGGSGAPADDLKRIRGIGVLIEKKLNSLGVVSYEQVANWTGADIDRISQILDFKGRIERENWVEQARILASGGQTEFSRRVDRGEVDSSR